MSAKCGVPRITELAVTTASVESLEQIERDAIRAALEKYGTATAAAQHLRIARATIQRKMKRYDLRAKRSKTGWSWD